jgi:hypothetical protein
MLSNDKEKKMKIDFNFTLLTVFLALLVVLSFQTLTYSYDVTVPYFNRTPYNLVNFYIGSYIANMTNSNDKIWTTEGSIGFFAERLIVAPSNSDWPFRAFFTNALGYSFNVDRANDMKDFKEGFISTEQLVEAWEKEGVEVLVFIHGQGWIPYPDDLLWNGFRNQSGVAEYVREKYELRLIVTAPEVSYVYYVWVRK